MFGVLLHLNASTTTANFSTKQSTLLPKTQAESYGLKLNLKVRELPSAVRAALFFGLNCRIINCCNWFRLKLVQAA